MRTPATQDGSVSLWRRIFARDFVTLTAEAIQVPTPDFAYTTCSEARADEPHGGAGPSEEAYQLQRTLVDALGGSMADAINRSGWNDEDSYWRTTYSTRPYASSAGRDYSY